MKELTKLRTFLALFVLFLSVNLSSAAVSAPQTDAFNGGRGTSFNENWKFYLGDVSTAYRATFNDGAWRQLNLPHDWSVELPFNRNSPATGSAGWLDGGTAWYRKTFTLADSYAGKRITIQFEGVYMNSSVYINGTLLGTRPYGYSTFEYDLTPYIKTGATANVIAVKVVNNQPTSRWYSGSGIYRNVWLTVTNPVHVAYCGTNVTTPRILTSSATVNAQTKLQNHSTVTKIVSVVTSIYDQDWKQIVSNVSQQIPLLAGRDSLFNYSYNIQNPTLWSLTNPYLYKIKTQIVDNNNVLDTYITPFGIRSIAVGANFGFKLNGVQTKLRGVCMHHDLGSLGAAQNYRALERQVEILKSFGCNAIRTSHNPPAPALLEICDRLGVVIVNEAFDMWKVNKNRNDYANNFSEWAKADIQEFVRRDRNHPSVVMWSIGNEIPEQTNNDGLAIAKDLISWVREEDPNRPITNAMNQGQHYKLGPILDVVGYNYDPASTYNNDHVNFPNWVIMGSETSSAIRTRGVYHLPLNVNNQNSPDMQCSSFDNTVVGWGQSAEDSWTQDKTRSYVVGQFIWTGFDYIGEPTPYGWPAKSSYFGIVDLCGFPKDIYYFYQSQWTTAPMVHLLPHWNWESGTTMPVWAYSNCDSVKLVYNGVAQPTRKMNSYKPYHAEWTLAFTPGKIKAFAYRNGVVVATDSIVTATKPAAIEAKTDRATIDADGKDQAFIETNILDENGIMVPTASNRVTYTVTGPGKVVGVDNGNPLSLESFKATSREAFNGKCLAIVQSTGAEGQIVVTATTPSILTNIALNKKAKADSEEIYTPTNLALNQPTFTDTFQPDRPVYLANDGNTGTRWCAINGNTDHWLTIDLGSVKTITGTEIMWESKNAYQYKIEVSTDNSTWSMAYDNTSNSTSQQIMADVFNSSGRYVRITITGNLNGNWASIYEFKVFDGSNSLSPNPRLASSGNDDSSNTFWTAADGNAGHSWAVNLGSIYGVNRTQVEWLNSGVAYKYKVDTSLDSLNWTVAVNKTGNTNSSQLLTDSFNVVQAKFVRITITGGTNSTNKAGFKEFRVYDGSKAIIKSATVIINSVKPSCLSCTTDSLISKAWINVNETGWTQANKTTVTTGSNIVFSTLSPETQSWQWTGPNGFAASTPSIKIENVQARDSGEYVAIRGNIRLVFKLQLNENTALVNLSDVSPNIFVYPNPSKNGIFNVLNCKNKRVSVFKLDGENIYNNLITTDMQALDLSSLQKGVYIVRFASNTQIGFKKIVISD